MERSEQVEARAPLMAHSNLEEFVFRHPEAAYLLVEYLSEEVQGADCQVRMAWEQLPGGFPIGRA